MQRYHRTHPNLRVYVASRVDRAEMWRTLRGAGWPITSTWIDYEDSIDSHADLWKQIHDEIRRCSHLVFYGDVTDAPWKGALVEVGMALAMEKPVLAVVIGGIVGPTKRPIGSWLDHPSVRVAGTLNEAMEILMMEPR